jgi:hypothetical protein
MPIFFNLSDEAERPEARALSANAGAELTNALEVLMRILGFYETRRKEGLGDNRKAATQHFYAAGGIFQELEAIATVTHVAIPPRLQGAWAAAEGFAGAIGPVLRQDFARAPVRPAYTVKELMNFAAHLASKLGEAIEKLDPNAQNSLAGRQIAAQALVLQMFGILVAEVMSEVRGSMFEQ